MNSEHPVVIADRLTKKYGQLTALDQLSITVGRGEILGLIGPNGAGKTTAIKILVGLARPTSGAASIAGADCIRDVRKIKRLVGYMPDKFGSYDNMRVGEYLDFFGAAFSIPSRLRRQRIDEVLDTTSAEYMRDRYVETLSHGMQQRIGIARTLLHDPEVLILDEPANGLDPEARVEMRELLLRLAAMGKTLIVTSHILAELSRVCDRVAIITHGKLRACGSLRDIMQRISQRRTIEVQLEAGAETQRAQQIIREFTESDSEILPSAAEGIVQFRSAMTEGKLGELLALLIGGGVKVTQFRELQSDLEDAFLSVTRSAEAEESAHSETPSQKPHILAPRASRTAV